MKKFIKFIKSIFCPEKPMTEERVRSEFIREGFKAWATEEEMFGEWKIAKIYFKNDWEKIHQNLCKEWFFGGVIHTENKKIKKEE